MFPSPSLICSARCVLRKKCMLIVLLPECLMSPHLCSRTTYWVLHPTWDFDGCDFLRSKEMFSVKVKLTATWYILQFILSGTNEERGNRKWEQCLNSLQQWCKLGSASGAGLSRELDLRIRNTAAKQNPNSGLNQNKQTNKQKTSTKTHPEGL